MDFSYLVTATNDMFVVLAHSPEPSQVELREAFTIGCKALKRLEGDDEFIEAISLLRKRRVAHIQDFKSIVTDVNHFTQGFLEIERKVMLAAGLSENSWSYVSRFAREVRVHINEDRVNVDALRKAIAGLRSVACDIADQLHTTVQKAEEHKRARNTLGRVALGIGGAAVIGVNASVLAATVGLSTAGSAVSAAVGGGLITRAFEGGDV